MNLDWLLAGLWEATKTLLPWAVAVGSLVFSVRAHRENKAGGDELKYASKDSVREIGRRVDSHEGRIAALEAELKHMPTHEDMTVMRTDLAEVKGTMSGMSTAVSSMNNNLALITESLLRRDAGHAG